jgi:hypothetical protein
MNALHNAKIIYPSLCENRIVFCRTLLLPEILFLCLFKSQRVRLVLLLLLQIGRIPSGSVTITPKPHLIQREKTEKVD